MGAEAAFQNRIQHCPPTHLPQSIPLDAADTALLRQLRQFATEARLSPRLNLDRTCALIDPAPDDAVAVYGATLLRALDLEATRPIVLYRCDAAKPGFDELWLLRIVRLFQQGDEASARFLIAGRVPHRSRRKVAFLAARFAESLNELPI